MFNFFQNRGNYVQIAPKIGMDAIVVRCFKNSYLTLNSRKQIMWIP